jgi:hypothetical protein
LADQQFVDVDAKAFGVFGIERVFGVDEGGNTALGLRVGDGVERQGCFTRRFRSINFGDATAGQAPHSERNV